MKGPRLIWGAFGAALATVLGVMLFFTVQVLRFERSTAEAQAHAALEETVRLALWRMDSAAALLMDDESRAKMIAANEAAPMTQTGNAQRFEQETQSQISRQEFQQRAYLNSNAAAPTRETEWRKIEPVLLDRIADILPGAKLEPVAGTAGAEADNRRLASIPARLMVPPTALPDSTLPWNTALRVSLMVAWACVLLAAAAVAGLLGATLSLSERRGAFASAVTHELRTPLTTFRMYAEMLSSGMVAEGPARQEYLRTLVSESDRLGHMIENVLAYSRLEKRLSGRTAEAMSVEDLLGRALPSLKRRVEQGGLTLRVVMPARVGSVLCRTDPVAVQQILLNLVDNACKYGRTAVELTAAAEEGRLTLTVADGGPGIRGAQGRLFTAFGKSKTDTVPGIGLGLFLSRQLARELGGDLEHRAGNPGAVFALSLHA